MKLATAVPKPKRRLRAARQPIARSGKPKAKKRTASEFARIYGSRARTVFVKSLRCTVGICVGWPVEQAHTQNGGMGRKGDAASIVPMCFWHHKWLHSMGVESFRQRFGVDLDAAAAETERRWQEYRARLQD
jgi:hypothetical protein